MEMNSPSRPVQAPVFVEREGDVVIVTLNRPDKMNALNGEIVEALLKCVEQAAHDGTRLLVLRGEGKNFSAGFDFGGVEEASEGDLVLRFIRIEQLLQAVYHAPFLTMALVHGKNFGAGVDLICACSHRIATADASFRMPGLRFGLVLGTRRFAACVGNDAARQILGQTRAFDAHEGIALGFLTAVAPREDWTALTRAQAQTAGVLQQSSATSLYRLTAADTRAADMADLVASASEPGLKARIKAYRSAG